MDICRKTNRVGVMGINEHIRRNRNKRDPNSKEMVRLKIPYNSVKLIDPETDRPGKVMVGYTDEGERVRVFKNTGSILQTPKKMGISFTDRISEKVPGQLDTSPENVHKVRILMY